MSHTSTTRWSDLNTLVSEAASNMATQLFRTEETYQDLLEVFAYNGNTAQGLADQLFFDEWSVRETVPGTPDTEANAREVALAQDAIDTMTAIHDLWLAANNGTVTAADRLASLRRFT